MVDADDRFVLDREHADTLMELLPPVGWADVATKHDLANLESRLTDRFTAELQRELRHQLWAILGTLVVAVFLSQLLEHLG